MKTVTAPVLKISRNSKAKKNRSKVPFALSAAALVAVLSVPAANAATVYWDALQNLPNGFSDGGTATTWSTAAGNWDNGTAEALWTNGNTAVFGGTASVVTIGTGGVTVGGLTFNATAYTLAAGTNGLTFSSGTDNITFAVPNPGNATAAITGTVGGTGANLVLSNQNVGSAAATLTFSGISTGGWTGTTTINVGVILATTTASGSVNQVLNSTSGITLNGGTIQFNRATNAQLNAISDSAAVTVNGGGTISVTSADPGGASAIETFAGGTGVTVNSGQANFVWTNGASSGAQMIIAGGLTVSGTSAVTFSGTLGSTGRWQVTGAGTTTAGQIIGPWATTGAANGVAAQSDYAVYASDFVAAAGIAASAASTWSTSHALGSNYTLANAAGSAANGLITGGTKNVNTVRATNNTLTLTSVAANVLTVTGSSFANNDAVQIGGTAPTGLANNTVYYVVGASGATFQLAATPGGTALAISGTVTSANIAGGITLSSGNDLGTFGILNANGAFLPIGRGTAGGVVTLPTTAAGNLYVTAGSAGIGIDAPITDNTVTGVLTLVKGGSSTLFLTGTNTYTGGTVLNSGTLQIGNVNNIGGASRNLTFGGSATLAPTAALNFSSGTLTVNQGALATIGSAGNVTFATTTGTGALAYNGANTLNLGNASGFTGTIDMLQAGTGTAGTVQFSGLGESAGSLLAFGGNAGDSNQKSVYVFNGSSPLTFTSTGRQVAITPATASNGGARYNVLQNNSANSGNQWVINSDLINTGARGAIELVLDGSNTDNNAFNGVIGNNTINGGALTVGKNGLGKWILGGSNTFTGRLIVSQGTLSVGTLNNSTVAGPLGIGPVQLGGSEIAPMGTGNGNVLGGGNSGILEYTGGAVTSTRAFLIGDTTAANTGGGTIANNSTTGAITFSAANLNTTIAGITATRTLTLGGSYTGANNIVQGAIVDNVANTGKVALTKANDASTWVLSGSSTYTGATTISGGTLALGNGGNLLGSSTIGTAVSVTGTLAVIQTADSTSNAIGQSGQTTAGSVTFNAGSALNMNDTFITTLNVVGASTTGVASGTSPKLTFDLNGATTGVNDLLAITGAVTPGTIKATIIPVFSSPGSLANTNTYTLITAASGLGAANFTLGGQLNYVLGGSVYQKSLATSTTTAEILSFASGANVANAYWQGGQAGNADSWSYQDGPTFVTNFTSDAAGSFNLLGVPSTSSSVFVSANTASNLSTMTLDAAFSIGGLTFTGTGTSNTVGSTIASGTGGTASTLTVGTGGITVQAGSGANTISAPVILGGAQSWTNNSGNLLTVSGNIDNGANLLTVAGSGSTTISGVLGSGTTKTGGLTVNTPGATVNLTNTNLFTGNTIITAGTLQLSGTGVLNAGNYTGTITNTGTLKYSSSVGQTLGGIISGTNGILTKDTNGSTLILTQANTYTGATNVNAGTLQLGTGGATGSIASTSSINLATTTSLVINNSATWTVPIITGAGSVTASLGTLTLNNTASNNFSGGFTLNSGSVAAITGTYKGFGTGKVTWAGGTLALTGGASIANDFDLNGATLALTNSNNTLTLGGTVTLKQNITFVNNSSTNDTAFVFNGSVGDGGNGFGLTLSTGGSSGSFTFNAVNTFTGGINVIAANTATKGRTLTIGGSGSLNSGDYSGNIANGNPTGSINYSSSANQILRGVISGAAPLTKDTSSTSTLTLAGNNTYTAGTNINAGILNLGSAQTGTGGPLGGSGTVASVGIVAFGGGTLQFSASNTTDYSSRFSTGATQAFRIDTNNQTVIWATGNASTGGTLTKLGLGTLNVTTAANAFTGATTINGGTLKVTTLADSGTNSGIGKGDATAATLVFGGGTLLHDAANVATTNRLFTIGNASGLTGTIDSSAASATNIMNFTNTGAVGFGGSGARTLTLRGSNTGANALAAAIGDGTGGATSVVKSDAGAWNLSGASNYTGATTVNGGTLNVSGSLTGTQNVNINAGTMLISANADNVVNTGANVTLNGGTLGVDNTVVSRSQSYASLALNTSSILDFGSGNGNTFSFASVGTHTGGSGGGTTLSLVNWTSTLGGIDPGTGVAGTDDRLIFSGSSSAFTSVYGTNDVSFNGIAGYAAINLTGGGYEIVPVPEPATTALIGSLALCALVGYRERHRVTRIVRGGVKA